MKTIALITFTLIFNQHLSAAVLRQTVTLDTAEIIASDSSAGDSDETVEVFFPPIELVFDLFNPALGTLDEVAFGLDYSYSSSVTTSTLTSSALNFDTRSSFNFFLTIAVNGVNVIGNGGGIGDSSTIPNEVIEVTTSPSTTSNISGGQMDAMGLEGIGPAFYRITPNSFAGTDHFAVSGYFTEYSVQRDAGLTMTVVYNYTPIPEPSSLLLLATAVPGLLIRRRLHRYD